MPLSILDTHTVKKFAADLAAALGLAAPVDAYELSPDIRAIPGAAFDLIIKAKWNAKGRVVISGRYADYNRIVNTHGLTSPGEITVDPARPIKAVAADIERRLIGPAQKFAATLAERLGEEGEARQRLQARVDGLMTRFPKLGARFREFTPNALEWRGSLYVEDMGSIDFTVFPDRYSVGGVTLYNATEPARLDALIALVTGL